MKAFESVEEEDEAKGKKAEEPDKAATVHKTEDKSTPGDVAGTEDTDGDKKVDRAEETKEKIESRLEFLARMYEQKKTESAEDETGEDEEQTEE